MKLFTAIILLCTFIARGCSKPLTPTYSGYQNIRVEKVGLKENIVAGEVKLFNPNDYSLQMQWADLDLYFNDKFVGNTKFEMIITCRQKTLLTFH